MHDEELECDIHGFYYESEREGEMCPGCYWGIQQELHIKERDL